MRSLLEFHLHTKEWGKILISRIVPHGDDSWGVFRSLEGTPWGDGIAEVPGEAFSHALHGRVMPLVRELGPEPVYLLKKIPEDWRICSAHTKCSIYQPKRCHPCSKTPDCYLPPKLSTEQVPLAAEIAMAWRNGFYVIAVVGPEFSF